MNRIQLILFSFIFSTYLFGQRSNSIEFLSSVDYNYRFYILEENLMPIGEVFNGTHRAKLNWRIGTHYNNQINHALYFKAGINLSRVGFYQRKGDAFWPDGTVSQINQSENQLYLELPIRLRKELGSRKIIPFFEFGLSPMFYLKSKHLTEIDGVKTANYLNRNDNNPSNVDFNNLQFAITLTAGANYALAKNWQLFFAPTFRYHMSPTANTPAREHYYNIGLEIGIRRFINKTSTTQTNK